MYHFRIKSDKKPNGTKISAIKHVEYINREGTFAHEELWKQSNKFVANFITTVQMPNTLDGINALLYKTDDFGSIKNSERGIEVTENFSHTTIVIALMLADKALNHQPLMINGSPDFHKTVLQVALQDKNPVIALKRELKNLTAENYIRTVKDLRFPARSEMREFGKTYNGADVYVKIRVELLTNAFGHTVFVMSFHFAEREFTTEIFPYKGK